jgi:hypothetical protein
MIGQPVSADERSRAASVDNFFRSIFPRKLADRLKWFESEFSLPKDRMLRLGGMSAADARLHAPEDWSVLCPQFTTECATALDLLLWYLESFRYEWGEAAAYLRTGAARLGSGHLTPPGISEDDAALARIYAGAPAALADLTAYLTRSVAQPVAARSAP